ncbi:hypothetical protein [Microbacterium sp. NPDC096154]|uniref:hypothetical protein n=1 Tax=Microbacterium sp. NPDC096154 TaxID=3155549 RepID=UPI0033336F0A
MSHAPTWRPAPRPGLVPLYPFGFGTALGRSFAVLRGNPRVLLGFAVGVQAVASLVGVAIIGAAAGLTFSRLDTVPEFTDEFDAIMAGSIAITAVVTLVVTLALSALNVVVQGVVVAEVSRAVVGERATLGQLWSLVKPAFWRLAGYFLLQLAVVLVLVVVVLAPLFIGAVTEQWGVALISFPLMLAMIPLWAWLGTKLYLVPSAIVLERLGAFGGIRRSWQLTRGRFWPTFGVMVLISVIVSVAAGVVSTPLQLLTTFLPTILMPLGESESDPGPAIGVAVAVSLASAALQVLVSAIGTIVTGAGGALMYVDARMRREGLDLRLQSYIEQRELGAVALPDPWAFDPSQLAPPRPEFMPVAHAPYPAPYPASYPAPPPGHPPYGQPPYGQPPYGQPPYGQQPYGQQPYGQQPFAAPYPPYPPAPPAPPAGGS